MTYFADGTPYGFLPAAIGDGAINVGWLDGNVPFEVGAVDSGFAGALSQLCRNGVFRTRGLHQCNLCPQPDGSRVFPPPPTVVPSSDGDYVVGGAEIRVLSADGVTYAAPDMIVHYVLEHRYRPPSDFIEAVAFAATRNGS